MKKLIAVVTLALMLSCGAFAQKDTDPATKEDVQAMLDAMQSKKMVDQMVTVMSQQMPALITEQMNKQFPNMTDDEKQEIARFVNEMSSSMFKNMPYDKMMEAMMPAYQKHLTHGDVAILTAFYSSPTGKKLLAEMPAITSESMQLMMPVMQGWIEQNNVQMQKRAEEFAQRMKEKQNKKDATPAKGRS